MDQIFSSLPILLGATLVTLTLAVVSMLIGLVIGIFTALARISKNKILYNLSSTYVSIIRGTPLLVQIYVIYFGLPQIGIHFNPITSGIIALSINVGAYLSESFRAAIQSVDKGQMEAASMLGMTYSQAMRRIIIPQSIRTALPTIGNTYIGLLKDTSLVSVITVTELLQTTSLIIARTFEPLPFYLLAGLIYWVLSMVFTLLQTRLEMRMSRHVQL
ncbi:amino acid ABC transporter permease [Bacillus sp. 31A1R]|uniref:Amino acid ABC transporter permease n=1 Tax=Robertmurraya mangrovi TaxID=3098077 RepID=A0ABU5J3U7_9BACI|nr:amino acid ABC transporter permease [Bacillus sp. 31A1R]MDZ5474079.1 amino acid ABC transporter permease [Bacillus sp. 31A1R]